MKIHFVRWLVIGSLVACLCAAATNALAQTEKSIRSQLGIPKGPGGPRNVFVIGEASHNDYDWVCTLDFYGKPDGGNDPAPCAQQTYEAGRTVYNVFKPLFGQDGVNGPPPLINTLGYYYNVAEIAFLRQYFSDNPDLLAPGKLNLDQLYIVGGGITSPSSVDSNGEAYIRNFLLGDLWVTNTLRPYEASGGAGRRIRTAWMPDDFGLDPELPAVLEAMDMPFVGFSRNAGNNPGNYSLSAIVPDPASNFQSWTALPDSPAARELPPCTKHTTGSLPAPYEPCLNADLTTDPAGTELIWRAQDGAQTFLHFMPGSYGQLKTSDIDNAADQAMAALTTAYQRNAAVSHRNPSGFNNYVYAPLSDDMMVPSKNILTVIKTFNCDNYWNQSPAAGCSGPPSREPSQSVSNGRACREGSS